MAELGRVEKLRLGRENLISIPDDGGAPDGDNGEQRIRGLRLPPKCREAERKPRTRGEAFRKLLQVERRVSIMKILVTVKEVAEPDDDFAIEDTDIAASDLEYDLNEWDDYAIEAAVQLAEAGIADEVVTVTIGPERAEETIEWRSRRGRPRRAGLGRRFRGRVRRRGRESHDIRSGRRRGGARSHSWRRTGCRYRIRATGVALAERIGFEHAAVVNDLEVDADAGVAHVHRELEGGIEELTDVDLPAVLTVQTGLNEPRYASLRGIRQAQRKEIDAKDLADLGLSADDVERAGDHLDVRAGERVERRDHRRRRGESASRLAEVLREKGERVMSDVLVVSEHRRGSFVTSPTKRSRPAARSPTRGVATFTSR